MSRTMLASELFAAVSGVTEGRGAECHWCGKACGVSRTHNEPIRRPFVPFRKIALRPGSQYVCEACTVYARPRVTVWELGSGRWRDMRCLAKESWLMTPSGVRVITPACGQAVWEKLTKPPDVFSLSLTTTGETLLQFATVNVLGGDAVADTPLTFTADGRAMTYSVYELEQFAETGELSGKSPGTRWLCERFDWKANEPVKRGRGRPPASSISTPQRRIVPS